MRFMMLMRRNRVCKGLKRVKPIEMFEESDSFDSFDDFTTLTISTPTSSFSHGWQIAHERSTSLANVP